MHYFFLGLLLLFFIESRWIFISNMKTPTREIANWIIPTGQCQPGKLSPKKISTQVNYHLDNSHPGQSPTRTIPTRKISTLENSHLANFYPG